MNNGDKEGHIFISHASADDEFVKELRLALEGQGISVWVDSRNLLGGSKLESEIEQAIKEARQFIAVISPNTVNSPWVRKEISKALEVEEGHKDDGYRVIPLLLPGIEPAALMLWFDKEPVGVRVELKTGGVSEVLPAIMAALGERLPNDFQPIGQVEAEPVEELILELTDPEIHTDEDGRRRARATAILTYEPANPAIPRIESTRFRFAATMDPIEMEDLSWYLERYYVWPVGVFKDRAERIEKQLPMWGQELYEAALEAKVAQIPLNAWCDAAEGPERRFSVMVDSSLPDGASEERG